MLSVKWAKPVATELLVVRMRRPFAAKPAVDWVMKECFFYMELIKCRHVLGLALGPISILQISFFK